MKLNLNYNEIYPNIIARFRDSLSQISNTGALSNSFKPTQQDSNLKISFLQYGEYVDSGRAPGKFPPVKPIQEWAKTKGIPGNAAWAIAKSIEKNGIKPRPFIQPTLNDIVKDILVPQIEKQVTPQVEQMVVNSLPKEIDIKL